jgi:hypothetical protein
MEYKNIILRTEVIINKKNNIVLELDSVTTTKVVRDTWSVPSEIRHHVKKNEKPLVLILLRDPGN